MDFPQLIISAAALTLAFLAIVVYRRSSGTVGRLFGLLGAIRDNIGDFEFPTSEPTEAVQDPRIEALEARVRDLTTAVETGVLRVQRSENRVREVVRSARKELAEAGFSHAGVEAEADELRELDGDDKPDKPVPAVQPDVVARDFEPSGIPGITVAQARLLRRSRNR